MYRILTEDKNRRDIYNILNSLHIEGFTCIKGTGSWHGVRENCLAIDLVDVPIAEVLMVARAIKEWNKQESVLVLEIKSTSTFV